MSLREDILPYLDSYGMVAPQRGGGSNNGLLYSCLYIISLSLSGDLRDSDVASWRGLLARCEVAPGLYRRSPGCGDLEAIDDYTALLTGAALTGATDVASSILARGRQTTRLLGPIHVAFAYNWINPGTLIDRDGKRNIGAWIGRVGAFRAQCYYASRNKCPWWLRGLWAITQATSGLFNKRDQDARVLAFLNVLTAQQGWPERLAIWIWKWRLRREWPGGLGAVFTAALSPDHPLALFFATYAL